MNASYNGNGTYQTETTGEMQGRLARGRALDNFRVEFKKIGDNLGTVLWVAAPLARKMQRRQFLWQGQLRCDCQFLRTEEISSGDNPNRKKKPVSNGDCRTML